MVTDNLLKASQILSVPAVELQNGGISAKAYFFPNMKSLATGLSPGKLFFDAIEKLNLPGLNSPVRHLRNFLDVGDDGIPSDSAVSLFLLGCDLCNPIESRIKLYVTDQIVTWDRVSAMWTLRGARQKDPQSDKGLTLLRKLWDLLEIPEGYRGNIRPDFPIGTPPPEDYRPVGMANWTLSTTKEFPDPQIYLLTFGMNDAKVVDALVAFYEVVGWVDLARSYREKVAAYFPDRDLTKTNYVHSKVSFSYRNSKPYLSVYYSPI